VAAYQKSWTGKNVSIRNKALIALIPKYNFFHTFTGSIVHLDS